MKHRDERRAFNLAAGMVIELDARMPCRCMDPDALLAVVWPLACRVAVAGRKASSNAKHARKWRKLQREVAAELDAVAEVADTPVPAGALARSIPMDAAWWRLELVPGEPALAWEREVA